MPKPQNHQHIDSPLATDRLTLAKVALVRSRQEFDAVFASGRRHSEREFLMLARKNNLPIARFGITVGRRFGNAVARNRVRRLAREAFRLDRTRFPVGWDFVVVPRQPAMPDRLEEIRKLLLHAAERITADRRSSAKSGQPRNPRRKT